MPLRKEVKGFGVPWGGRYGYAYAVRVDDTIYVSGQRSHDSQQSAKATSYRGTLYAIRYGGLDSNRKCCSSWQPWQESLAGAGFLSIAIAIIASRGVYSTESSGRGMQRE